VKVTITRCELVPGSPPPPLDPAAEVTEMTKDRYGQDVEEVVSYGEVARHFSGPHYEVEATVDSGGPTWILSAEFEASYPLDEIPKAMLHLAQLQSPQRIVGMEVTE
jgi:hypothetical protein